MSINVQVPVFCQGLQSQSSLQILTSLCCCWSRTRRTACRWVSVLHMACRSRNCLQLLGTTFGRRRGARCVVGSMHLCEGLAGDKAVTSLREGVSLDTTDPTSCAYTPAPLDKQGLTFSKTCTMSRRRLPASVEEVVVVVVAMLVCVCALFCVYM